MGPKLVLVLVLALVPVGLGRPLPAHGERSLRTLPVTLVTDRSFQELPQWRGLIRSAVQRATEDLAEEPGLRFSIRHEITWSPAPDVASLEEVLDRAIESVDRDGGLLAVFLGQRPGRIRDPEELGLAYLGRPALLVLGPDAPLPRAMLRDHLALYFRHELGHVFGIPHIRGRSVMNPMPDRMVQEFGMLALEVLRANRDMDFNTPAPFSGSDLPALRDVYLLLHGQGDMELGLLVNLGTALNREGDFASARTVFLAARDRDRRAVGPRLGLAESTLSLGDTLEARSILDTLRPESTWLVDELGWMGTLCMGVGQWERAHSLFTRALDQDGERFGFLVNRGLASYRMARYQEAADDYRSAIQVDDQRPEVWFNLGLTLNRQGKDEDAVAALERYLELEPTGTRAREARLFIEAHR